jgi:hypothetical protein
MVALVRKHHLLGDADRLTLGITKGISAAKHAIIQIASAKIKGKVPREVSLALCKGLH